MMKKRVIVPLLVLLGVGLFFYLFLQPAGAPGAPLSTDNSPAATATPQELPPVQGPQVVIGTTIVPLGLAQTSAEVQKGLSGRPSLDPDKGLLFLFPKADIYKFWMPDMNFPIDIIWISSAKKVIGVSSNVSNEFDPANPKFYTPPTPAQYVLEVNAGFASRNNIKAGDSVEFIEIET